MLFNSGLFFQFFAAFVLLYYSVRGSLRARNILIVIASYVFYGWWDYRFLSLLLVSSLLDYFVGIGLEKTGDARQRKMLVTLSITGNLALLGFFKYFDFFVESFGELIQALGLPFRTDTLGIILPVGISFYTFQTMSYTLDVYRRDIQPTRNLIQFLAYVSFFPQLVAGPIERARHLLPQFQRRLTITIGMIEEGLWLTIWGLFKKVVIADNLDPLVEMVYGTGTAAGPLVILATLAFGLQIYSDFSGYSDIARGIAKMLGFDLMQNFALPYFAGNVREFWRRWHISLSTWLRDYLYLSLGGNRRGRIRTHFNLLITMLLGGLWHGAAWNFVLWGLWHGVGLSVHRIWSSHRPGPVTGWRYLAGWFLTMLFVFYGWLLFRAGSWGEIVAMTGALTDLNVPAWWQSYSLVLAVFSAPILLVQLWQSRSGKMNLMLQLPRSSRAAFQGLMIVAVVIFWEKEKVPFIYFQF